MSFSISKPKLLEWESKWPDVIHLRLSPHDEPVYQFMDKKRAEGKLYFVYMTAAANKFLRIYYARVKECMASLGEPPAPIDETL